MTELKDAHDLILDLHTASPAALMNVIPQLEEELKFEDEDLRQLAMETLGKLFCQNHCKVPMTYPQTWHAWLDRY